jgi:glycosyltransferase involved in cell wall biosynthesis
MSLLQERSSVHSSGTGLGVQPTASLRIAVVIPSYRVKAHLLKVIADIPALVERIYVVDDACPEGSGALVEAHCSDARVRVHRNAVNLGVGGAVMAGYRLAQKDGMDIVVKMDGDGQMDPAALPELVGPIVRGEADYTKGNRFYDLTQIGSTLQMAIPHCTAASCRNCRWRKSASAISLRATCCFASTSSGRWWWMCQWTRVMALRSAT